MGKRNQNQKITLEALLELKRHERPGDEFWDSFETDFHRRRLNILFEQQSIRESVWNPTLKAVVFGVPALLLVGMTVLWSRLELPEAGSPEFVQAAPAIQLEPATTDSATSREAAGNAVAHPVTSLATSQFVLDAIQDDPPPVMNFRKVLYTPAIQLSVPTGASYVRDTFSSSNYEVTTANLQLGRNF
ncbi:MAG: hypothetical protein ACP5I4_03825 [Oceanipulchritudo sp.]|jgi:hypothetical protein